MLYTAKPIAFVIDCLSTCMGLTLNLSLSYLVPYFLLPIMGDSSPITIENLDWLNPPKSTVKTRTEVYNTIIMIALN